MRYILTEEQINFFKNNITILSMNEMVEKLLISKSCYSRLKKKYNLKGRYKNFIVDINYRFCPICQEKIVYKKICHKKYAQQKNQKCRKCSNDEKKIKYKGENNPFYGKKHTDESKVIIKKCRNDNKEYYKSEEFKKIMSDATKGEKNSMFGKSNYYYWNKKYGKEIADEKLKSFKLKTSIANSGEKNPMFGIPPPIGSGNGWSGWYKGWYFRSLIELSYMIKVIERFNIPWENGELKKFKISYIDEKGLNKNYFPDFILNNKYIVECKPKKLWNTNINKLKIEFGKEYCKKNNMIYKIRDCKKLKTNEILELYINGKIKFIQKYEEKIKSYLVI